MTKTELFHLIRSHLDILEACDRSGPGAIAAGDVVQLKPDADPVFGGMLLRVTRTNAHRIEGYLLTPHRGGCRDAWYRFPPSCVSQIGRLLYPEAAWGFRPAFAERKEVQRELSLLRPPSHPRAAGPR